MIFVRLCDYMEDVIKHISDILNFEGTTDLVAERNKEVFYGTYY